MKFTTDWFSQHKPNWLRWLAEFKDKPCNALEIGSFEGRSALWLCDAILTHPESRLTCVDAYNPSFSPSIAATINQAKANFLHNTKSLREEGKITHFCMTSQEYLLNTPASFDLIYVDGCHKSSAVLTDAVLCWPKLRKQGLMIFDDYLWHNEPRGPKEAIDAFILCFEPALAIVEKGYQVCIRKTA